MDSHALSVVEFGKVRNLLAGYAKTTMGRELIERIEPMTDAVRAQAQIDLIGELVAAFEQGVGSSRVDLQACKLEYSIVSPK